MDSESSLSGSVLTTAADPEATAADLRLGDKAQTLLRKYLPRFYCTDQGRATEPLAISATEPLAISPTLPLAISSTLPLAISSTVHSVPLQISETVGDFGNGTTAR